MSPSGELPEIIELKGHPWFVGVQFPSRTQIPPVSRPHPLFASFVKAAIKKQDSKKKAA